MKIFILTLILSCSTAHAEWYRVRSVPAYNTISAAKADGENEPITIRIRNLEKIEYIQSDPEKVLIGGEEAISLSISVLKDQLVWVENLKAEEGAYIADVYPSFEQVITVYKEKRIVNGDNISTDTKEKLRIIYKQMLTDLNLLPLSLASTSDAELAAESTRMKLHKLYLGIISGLRSDQIVIKSNGSTDSAYENEFARTEFTAEAIIWFRNNGQYMHPAGQKLYIDLLQSFQNDMSQDARYSQYRIEVIQKQHTLFSELFLEKKEFERGKFTYTCLDWFKSRGQYLPENVQSVFVNWLRAYQQTTNTESDFMKQRLQWMMDNNGLYQDFLDLGN